VGVGVVSGGSEIQPVPAWAPVPDPVLALFPVNTVWFIKICQVVGTFRVICAQSPVALVVRVDPIT
jgi:hypothetical protein